MNTPTFEIFWDSYPRKVNRAYAERCYVKAAKKHGAQTILDGLARWVRTLEVGTDPKFLPHASTWLNQERYRDSEKDLLSCKAGRFENKPNFDAVAPGPRMVWVGGRGFGAMDIIGLERKLSLRQPLDPQEQAALEKWNGTA